MVPQFGRVGEPARRNQDRAEYRIWKKLLIPGRFRQWNKPTIRGKRHRRAKRSSSIRATAFATRCEAAPLSS
jgi:hypothetical protein